MRGVIGGGGSGSGMTNPMQAAGDIIVGGAGGDPTRLAAGGDGQELILSSGTAAWAGETTWTVPTLGNGWTSGGGADAIVGYRKLSSGLVVLTGVLHPGTWGATIFTLPAGYQPGAIIVFGLISGIGIQQLVIDTTGAVSINQTTAGTTTYVGLNGAFFVAGA